MNAAEYFRKKRDFLPYILSAYHSLASENDIIVIEGAGSPAEINLKQEDIVNMGLAELVDAPVLLVGDIDRGGVFAQLYGTIALLEEDERRRIKGTIINKFRGDKRILEPGIPVLETLCGVPVAGLIPYLSVDIADEDSLSCRLTDSPERKDIDIAVIRLPRISNFTDFDVFSRYNNVSLRYVDQADKLLQPDLLLIPGTKSTISDLLWLRQSGLEAAIRQRAAAGTPVIGICGGYQMLGQRISDPNGSEAAAFREINGIGLLDIETVFSEDKVQRQCHGLLPRLSGLLAPLSGLSYEGYELHMGRSGEAQALVEKGNIYGSYIHGLFDNEKICDTLIQALCDRKGLPFHDKEIFDRNAYTERQYDQLAEALRQGMDMDYLYRVLNQEV